MGVARLRGILVPRLSADIIEYEDLETCFGHWTNDDNKEISVLP